MLKNKFLSYFNNNMSLNSDHKDCKRLKIKINHSTIDVYKLNAV